METRAVELYLDVIPPVLHFGKVDSIRTVIHIVRRYPLVSVMSSLCRNTNNLHPSRQINLQPLVMVVMTGGPGPHQPATACAVKSGQPSRMVCIPLRRGCHGRILDAAILNSNRLVVKPFWNKIKSRLYLEKLSAIYKSLLNFPKPQTPTVFRKYVIIFFVRQKRNISRETCNVR